MRSEVDVLVVEDAEDLRSVLVQLLEDEGYRALGTGNGLDGLRLIRELQPRVVLCDVMLPGMDGLSIWRAAHDDGGANTAFVFTSASPSREVLETGVPFIPKPFDLSDVLSLVEHAVRWREQWAPGGDKGRETTSARLH